MWTKNFKLYHEKELTHSCVTVSFNPAIECRTLKKKLTKFIQHCCHVTKSIYTYIHIYYICALHIIYVVLAGGG